MSDIEPMSQATLLEHLKRGIIVRAALDLSISPRTYRVHIETLTQEQEDVSQRATNLVYTSIRPRVRHQRRERNYELSVEFWRLSFPEMAAKLSQRWAHISVFWSLGLDAVAAVITPGGNVNLISMADPRLLGEYQRMQLLLDFRINHNRGEQAHLIRAYNLLGRFIEVQNRAWSQVLP